MKSAMKSSSIFIKLKLCLTLLLMMGLMGLVLFEPAFDKVDERLTFKVEVKGAAYNSGIFEARKGMCINDLLKEVDLKEEADLSTLNLNQLLSPEMVIVIAEYHDDRVSINTADLEELDSLEGIGPSLAQAIIDYRQKEGGFKELEELMEVKGIGENKFAKIKEDISL